MRATELSAREEGPEVLASRRPRRLLIVDEDAEMRGMLRIFLGGEGVDVVEAGSSTEALVLAREGEYAGVIVNAGAGEEGLKLLPTLRQLVAGAPVVLMTAVPGRPTSQRALALGAAALLVKPFGLDELLQLLIDLGATSTPGPAGSADPCAAAPADAAVVPPEPPEHRRRG
jgi:DNA-binding NtrC family response regulator